MKVLIIQNDAVENLGLYQRSLEENGKGLEVFHAYKIKSNERFPPIDEYDALIIGPTPISANDYGKHPFLVKEWELFSDIIGSGKPILGVCCGGQLLAKYLGANVTKSPKREVGGYEVELTEIGKNDPLFAGFPSSFPVFQWHRDMFEIPSGGSMLVKGDPCPIQAFGWRNVRGVIFHLEIDRREAERWADAYSAEIGEVGKTREQVLRECIEREPQMKALARRLMDNFMGLAK